MSTNSLGRPIIMINKPQPQQQQTTTTSQPVSTVQPVISMINTNQQQQTVITTTTTTTNGLNESTSQQKQEKIEQQIELPTPPAVPVVATVAASDSISPMGGLEQDTQLTSLSPMNFINENLF